MHLDAGLEVTDLAGEVAILRYSPIPIVLHCACAEQLGVHLIQDGREALLAGSPEERWGRRARTLVRWRLS
jgi:hypothetical protein